VGALTEIDDDPLAVALDPTNVLPRRIEHWWRSDPDRPFLVEIGAGRTQTFGSFRDLILRWARVLHDHGVRHGERIVSFLPSSVDAHAVWLAASMIGAYEVPVNPELRGEFLRHVLTDSGASLCIVRPDQAPILNDSGVAGLTPLIAAADSDLSDVDPLDIERLPEPGDVSCVIYTSGTTGPAKGVMITWAQMSATIGRIPRSWLSESDAVYSPWPMFHVTGRTPMCSMANVGGRVVLRDRFSLSDFWTDIRTHECTSTTIGAVTALLLDEPSRADDADNPLRVVFFGRAGRPACEFMERFDAVGVACYGSTEVGFPIVNRPIERGNADIAGWLRPGYEARVVDIDGADVPAAVGELWISPPDRRMILREYLGQPARTTEAVVDGWYRTSDAVRRHEHGGFEFVDRMSDTIRRFGENISATTLEDAVAADPDVLECAAVGVPSPVAGQEILLVIVPTQGCTFAPGALAGRLGETLPRYMRPAYIAVVDELPKTPNGKIRRVGLAGTVDLDKAWRGTGERGQQPDSGQSSHSPRRRR
jgi:crotonobetaine/carnitine-CoA ligase